MPTQTHKPKAAKRPAKTKIFTAGNPNLMGVLQGRFSTPSGNYFWHRKRKKVHDLLMHYVWSSHIAEGAPKTFVDVGCGLGVDLFMIRDWLNFWEPDAWQPTGVEVDPTSLEILYLKKDEAKADNVTFTAADITKPLPFADNSLDIVYSSEVIEHLSNPDVFIQEVHRVLKKPGGAFLLTTPNEPNVFQRTWWSAEKREQLKANMEALKAEGREVNISSDGRGGENAFIHHHVSLHTTKEWDQIITGYGFTVGYVERGAMLYSGGSNIHGGSDVMDNEWMLGLRFLVEAFLDLFPARLTRPLSDQLITLYLTV